MFKKLRLWLIKKLDATPNEQVNDIISSANDAINSLKIFQDKYDIIDCHSNVEVNSTAFYSISSENIIKAMIPQLETCLEIKKEKDSISKQEYIKSTLLVLRKRNY